MCAIIAKIAILLLSAFGLFAAIFTAHEWASILGAFLALASAAFVLFDASWGAFLVSIASIAVSVMQGADDLKKIDAPYMAAVMGKSAENFGDPGKYNLKQEDFRRLFMSCSASTAGSYFVLAAANVIVQVFDKTGLVGNITDPGEPQCTVVSKEYELKSPQLMEDIREYAETLGGS